MNLVYATVSTCIAFFFIRSRLQTALARKSDAISRVRPSVRLFPLYLLNQLIFDLCFCMCMDHNRS